ncbi:MAG: right-handed parallel beta-helix repeat-containing protein [Proteobacteria bacterium]|nr:right-handed parallel beta-helix repeat-containing protein [Pseudomonadota bacterium]MBU1738429.1 right-handed parallel beta-helix repeat-containing protein [Pseudomonadota bacterium]
MFGKRKIEGSDLNRHKLYWHTLLFSLVLPTITTPHALAGPLELGNQVISTNTTWENDIVIEGVVVVAREAILTIKPGTTISFRKVDSDNDGVGDSEIRVLGGLFAEGLPDKKIVFRSAEKSPGTKDWSYVLLFTSGSQNRISHCVFSHAHTGLQVQFSTASVIHSIFKDNHEGLRFGRADLSIEHSLFTGNDIGIRFTRMEGPALIKNNEITSNRIGIFLVPSGQNITDFFAPDRSGVPWNTGRLKIVGNNIYKNTGYNLNLGEKQFWDLDVTGNYWGEESSAEIGKTIFDRKRDEKLGQAIFTPFSISKFTTTMNTTNRENTD